MSDTTTWLAFGIAPEVLPTVKDPHITLAFMGDSKLKQYKIITLHKMIERILKFYPNKFEVIPEYPELWNSSLLVSPVMVPDQIKDLRQNLANYMFVHNIWFSTKHPWRPHITLGEKGSAHQVPHLIEVTSLFLQTPTGRATWPLQ